MNDDKAWFGPRRYGYGVSPRSWQGWAATAMFVFAEVAIRLLQGPRATPMMVMLAHVGVLAVFLVVVVATSSPGVWKWRGGRK